MSDDRSYSKGTSVELRVILIGDLGVGKKSIVQRMKLVNSTETKKNNFKGFLPPKKKKNKYKQTKKDTKDETSTKSKKTTTYESVDSTEEETEEDKLRQHREEKRANCMKFSKIYRLGFNSIDISFFPCAEEQPLSYDYELKEEDEFYEFEKEYRVSIKQLVKEIEYIMVKPPEDDRNQIEFLFILCFDLSNIPSFEKLVVYFSQINRHFKLTSGYKIVLVGNKIDKRASLTDEEKENIEQFKSKFSSNYYEISTLMFFNFDNFFEKLILDNFQDWPFLSEYANKFHEIITTKKSFPTTKRPVFGDGSTVPGSDKYNNNPYRYPDSEKEFRKMFKDRDKYNKHIFINKQSILYPPISSNDKDLLFGGSKKKSQSHDKKEMIYSFDSSKLEEVKAALELQSNKPGYTLGMKTYKPLGLFKERETLRKLRDREKQEALGGNIILMGGEKRVITEEDIEGNQQRYEKNRMDNWGKIKEENQIKQNNLKERHNQVNAQNDLSYRDKLNSVEEKQDKYTKLFEENKRNKEKLQNENYIKNNIKVVTGYKEPKCRFYDPVPSITTNKGFTFGKRYEPKKDKENISPDFPTFQDDFEKLIEKNKKRVVIKPLGPKISVNKSIEVGDSSKVMEKMKLFEKRRLNHLKNTFNDFFEDRKYRKDFVTQKKKEIETMQERNLQEQIQKTYKDDDNYLIRDINYGQVEATSPSFSMKGRYEIGSIFQTDKHDKPYEYSTPNKKLNLENPNFSLIRPRYPAFSFGKSDRFNSISNDGRNARKMKNKEDNEVCVTEGNQLSLYYYGDQDSQSFLKAQTTMGTGKKLFTRDNGYPGPNQYLIRGFADEVKLRGDKVNETRIMLKEKKKLEDLERQRKARLREERFEEKRKALKMSLRESLYGNTNNNNNDNADKEMHLDENNGDNNVNDDNDEDNVEPEE